MAKLTSNERIDWAVKMLNVQSNEHLLEIGCGTGMAVSQIAAQLKSGTITAIDASEAMIKKASERNKVFIAAQKAIFFTQGLMQFQPVNSSYDKIFAFNVNLFWTSKATQELLLIKSLLAPDGQVYLFYQLPTGSAITKIPHLLTSHLQQAAFQTDKPLYKDLSSLNTFCIIAKPVLPE